MREWYMFDSYHNSKFPFLNLVHNSKRPTDDLGFYVSEQNKLDFNRMFLKPHVIPKVQKKVFFLLICTGN